MNQNPLYVHIPAHLLADRLPFLLERRLQPEVACQDVTLDKLDFEQLKDCADQLRERGLSTTLHAPYSGFNPGSNKRRIRDLSRSMAERSLQLAEALNARRVVFHPGLAYGSSQKKQQAWIEAAAAFWPEFLPRAEELDTILCVENIYETEPAIFITLLDALNSPRIGHVFDIGHWNMFSEMDLVEWLTLLEPHLKHIHLHDNHGDRDAHLGIGQGDVPFSTFFDWLNQKTDLPTMTLENHGLPNLEHSLQAITQNVPRLNRAD